MIRLLVIDDDAETYALVSKALSPTYPMTWAHTLKEAWDVCHRERIDLILLDVMLPDGDGFQFCAKLQSDEKTRAIPIILVTGKKGVSHRILGFSLGADDYLEKPFDLLELRARVDAKLKKSWQHRENEECLVVGEIEINLGTQRALLHNSEKQSEIFLTPIEFRLLHHMARNCDLAFSRDQLMTAVWGEGVTVIDRTIDKHISALRQKLQHCGSYIETVPGFGYRFIVKKEGSQKAA
jgi:DNA-binding response OmpR family regulator